MIYKGTVELLSPPILVWPVFLYLVQDHYYGISKLPPSGRCNCLKIDPVVSKKVHSNLVV